MEPERFQVHCAHCNTSFAVGTPSCIHCGGRLGRGLWSDLGQVEDAAKIEEAPYPGEGEQAAGGPEGRSWLWIISVLVMLLITMARSVCS